ncbi:MAG: o-succinylbenzoate synthase [Opitutaceae bacterium]
MPSRLGCRRYRLPFRGPVRTAHGRWAEREGVLLRVERPDGSVGFGEAAPIPGFPGAGVDDVEAALRALGGVCVVETIDALPRSLNTLRAALRVAFQDEPLGVDVAAPAYLGVAALLPAGRAVLADLPAKAEAGFRVFKWKVGVGDIADELTLLDDVCAALPTGARLRLDANGAWDRRRAERWLERCAERPIEHVEQPCLAAPGDGETDRRRVDDLLLGLAGDFPTPIALDESLAGDADLSRWLALGWPGVFVVKLGLLGDAASSLAELRKRNVPVVFSSALETAVGARAALRAAFRWGGEPRALGFGVWPLFADARFDGPRSAPFVRREDVEAIDAEAVWNALN